MVTITVLTDMKIEPTAGVRKIPKLYSTLVLKGIASALYHVAQARFCIIISYVAFVRPIIATAQ